MHPFMVECSDKLSPVSQRQHLHNRPVGTLHSSNQDVSVSLSLILVQRHRKCVLKAKQSLFEDVIMFYHDK